MKSPFLTDFSCLLFEYAWEAMVGSVAVGRHERINNKKTVLSGGHD
jgi:hypothetical protein